MRPRTSNHHTLTAPHPGAGAHAAPAPGALRRTARARRRPTRASFPQGPLANQPGEQLQAVDAKDAGLPDVDFTGAADVRADVRDGTLQLVVDGRSVLTQDHRTLVPESGEFGVRPFAQGDQLWLLSGHLDGDPATLTIRD